MSSSSQTPDSTEVSPGSNDYATLEHQQLAEAQWQRITEQIATWHFKPDLEAVKVILAMEASYRLNTSEHLWLHLIGPSSSGKTSLGIAMLDGLWADHHQLGEITPNTFLSGLTRGKMKGKMNSFLHQIGDRGLIYAPDFTNFLGMDEISVRKVAGQLREIYDGHTSKRAGSMESANDWYGNLGFITAFTPSVEGRWHSHNREGERFLTLRWPGVEAIGDEEEDTLGGIMKRLDKHDKQVELRELVREFLVGGEYEPAEPQQPSSKATTTTSSNKSERPDAPAAPTTHTLTSPGTSAIANRSFKLAKLLGQLRTLPVRSDGRTVSHVAGIEGPGRAFKQLLKCARAWASLCRRDEVSLDDWRLAERIAIDTIPATRRWLLESLPWGGGVTRPEVLVEMTPFENVEAVMWHLSDLIALKVVGMNKSKEVWVVDEFEALVQEGCPSWVAKLTAGYEERVEGAVERQERGVVWTPEYVNLFGKNKGEL